MKKSILKIAIAVSIVGMYACSSNEKTTTTDEVVEVEMTEEEVVEVESITEEVSAGADAMVEEVEELGSDVDSLLNDI